MPSYCWSCSIAQETVIFSALQLAPRGAHVPFSLYGALAPVQEHAQMERHIQSYLRQAASRWRETQRIGPLLATFTPHDANPFLNYAIPDEGAVPTPAETAALIAAFQQRSLAPRLEYLPALAPSLEPILLAAGFVIEDRMPLMVCPQEAWHDIPVPEGIEIIFPPDR